MEGKKLMKNTLFIADSIFTLFQNNAARINAKLTGFQNDTPLF
jgi:hypothetical protein